MYWSGDLVQIHATVRAVVPREGVGGMQQSRVIACRNGFIACRRYRFIYER